MIEQRIDWLGPRWRTQHLKNQLKKLAVLKFQNEIKKVSIIIQMVLIVVRRFFREYPFFIFCCLFHIDILWTSYPGYIFLFSGSHSEQDDSVEHSEVLEPLIASQTSELESTNFNNNLTLYEILGVNRFATSQEIRNAYLALSKINYPKLKDGNSFKFKLISRSYRILFN